MLAGLFTGRLSGGWGVRVVVCLGEDAELAAIARLEADNPGAGKYRETDRFVAEYGPRVFSKVYRNGGGVTVVRLPHPSRFIWTDSKSNPTELVLRALGDGGRG